ncbi:MAG: hypothetical protein EBU88_19800, partial [Acidobacteria bacterium]|nr:hypothetical protein [Acidobacteriota bacterium]
MGELVEPDDGILHTTGSGGGALRSTQDTQAQVWELQDDLYRKAAMLAQLHGHKMEYFCVSDADLKELGNDERRIMRLRIKLGHVDALLAGGPQSSVPNPQTLLAPLGPSEMPVRTTQLPFATGHTDGLRFTTLPPLVQPPSSNESGSTASPSSTPAPHKRTFWTLATYMKIYNALTAARSSSAQLGAPARSVAPFGELDRSTQPLLPIPRTVLDNMKTKPNVIKQHEREATREQPGSPQYMWSWIVYYLRHIGRPALADEVREKFKEAHPNLEKKCGGRAIGHGFGQEWLSVPVAMAAAFPNGELSAVAYPNGELSA